ncbi:MAG: hypothetical protein ABIR03_07045 [Ginsengibacter sp.]
MEIIYTAYTREVNNQILFFVKKFTSFPDYENAPKVLDNYGMHSNFFRACDIAEIYDEAIINNLLDQLHIIPESAKVIPMQKEKAKSLTHFLLKNTHNALLKLRLAGIN